MVCIKRSKSVFKRGTGGGGVLISDYSYNERRSVLYPLSSGQRMQRAALTSPSAMQQRWLTFRGR